jgi:transcriptional regulator with XRE-family HTH domain
MSLAGLQNITGVGQGQLSHYLNGQRNPSKATTRKVNEAIHAFAEELSKVEIVQP